MTLFESTLNHWQQTPSAFTPESWQSFISQLSLIPFTPATLEIDATLWGSFWQGDVIAPGYVLPALELAFLRATRLEATFTESTPEAFLQTLQTTLTRFPHGVWLATFGPSPGLCIAYADSDTEQYFIIWLVEGAIVAGYRDNFISVPGCQLLPIRDSPSQKQTASSPCFAQQDCLSQLSDWHTDWSSWGHATRIDRLILLHRVYGATRDTKVKQAIEDWVNSLEWS